MHEILRVLRIMSTTVSLQIQFLQMNHSTFIEHEKYIGLPMNVSRLPNIDLISMATVCPLQNPNPNPFIRSSHGRLLDSW